MDNFITNEQITAFGGWLKATDHATGTIEKYQRDIRAFALWLSGKSVTRERVLAWREQLLAQYKPVTINSMLAAVNSFFGFCGWVDCRVSFLKIQRQLFRDTSRELTRSDYERLLHTARSLGQERLALLMETIGSTGIRVSELRYITVETAKRGRAEITLKGKIRSILLPKKLCRKLLQYARSRKITTGEIFLTESGNPLSRRQIWSEMKRLSTAAGVDQSKVFPHNLRHMFAVVFYRTCRDVALLSDVLGHSAIETTRIYLLTTGEEHRRQLDRLELVL